MTSQFEQTRRIFYREHLKHCWYLLTCFWDCQPEAGSGDLSARILVDRGQAPLERNNYQLYLGSEIISGVPIDFTWQSGDPSAIFHLGRRGNSPDDTNPLSAWGAPDITLDEFAIYDFGTPSSTAINRSELMARTRFEAGRFYKESTYEGLVATPGTNNAGEYFSAPLSLGPVFIRALAWTQMVPRGLRSPGGGAKPEYGDPGPDGRVALELVSAAGDAYLQDAGGRDIDTLFTRAEGHGVRRSMSGLFRLHAVFQPNLNAPDATAILDPLVLDDLSIVYRREPGQRLVAWGQGGT
jgi:hypothetical protein